MRKLKNSLISLTIIILLPAVIYAVFFDNEISSSNTFNAATLDIQFTTPDSKTFELTPEVPVTVNTQLINIGTLSNNNALTFVYKSGEWNLASVIDLNISGDVSHTANLTALSLTGIFLSSTKNISFTFNISEQDYLEHQGESVSFKIVDLATQIGSTYPNGFYDTEKLLFTISIPAPINEIIEPGQNELLNIETAPPEVENNITPEENINNEETI